MNNKGFSHVFSLIPNNSKVNISEAEFLARLGFGELSSSMPLIPES